MGIASSSPHVTTPGLKVAVRQRVSFSLANLWQKPATKLLLLTALVILVRMPGLARPLLGNFSTKGAVYGMIARNWASGAAPWYRPTLDCLVDGQPGWHLLEVPLSAYVAGGAWSLLGGSLDLWGRLTSILFYTGGVLYLWHLVARWHGTRPAWAASLAMTLAPVGIIYGQAFMLESSAIFFVLGAMFHAQRWSDARRLRSLLATALFVAAALLTKIYLAALLLPITLLLLGANRKTPGLRARFLRACSWRVALPAALTLAVATVPALLWQAYVAKVTTAPDATVYYSLRNSLAVHQFPHPLLMQADFYRGLLDNLGTVVLTPVGLVLAALGLAHREAWRHWGWILGAGVIVVAMPLKFVEMNYYFVPLLPLAAVLIGLGWEQLMAGRQEAWKLAVPIIFLAVLLSARYSAKPAFVHPEEDRAVPAAGQAVAALALPHERVVAMHGSSLDLLYYCGRRGWAISPRARNLAQRVENYQREGAAYLVISPRRQIARVPQLKSLVKPLAVADSGPDYIIYRLTSAAGSSTLAGK